MNSYYLCPISSIFQYFNDQGIILSGGKINTYLAGTSTATATYTDVTGNTSNSNPIIIGSNGRLNNVQIWQVRGSALKIVITDSNNNQLGPVFDQIVGINDPTFVISNLGTAASGQGADLVANAMRSYDIVSSVRAAVVPNLEAGQTLIIFVEGGSSVGDGAAGQFYWSASSTATDDGINVIKPNLIAGGSPGRYLALNYTQGSFLGTFTGFASPTSNTVYWTKSGYNVILTIASGASNTSNAITFTMTGLPAFLQPATRTPIIPLAQGGIEDSGAITFASSAGINLSPGVITFLKAGNASGWTNSGVKGFTGFDSVLAYSTL